MPVTWWVPDLDGVDLFCLTHCGLKCAAKARISLIMAFNFPSTMSEMDTHKESMKHVRYQDF